MKKILLIMALLIAIYMDTKAQQEKQFVAGKYFTASVEDNKFSKNIYSSANNGPAKDYDYYMRKKKNNLTAGLVTLGGGLLLSGIGVIIASNTSAFDDDASGPAIFLIAGAASGIVSIPLMIMATVYGHKAKLELSKQKTGFGVPANVSKDIVGITLQIPLGK